MTPTLCPACLRDNRIATIAGPTCPHTGQAWFPPWWCEPGMDARRVEWVRTQRAKADKRNGAAAHDRIGRGHRSLHALAGLTSS